MTRITLIDPAAATGRTGDVEAQRRAARLMQAEWLAKLEPAP